MRTLFHVICCLLVPVALLAQQAHIPAGKWAKADSVAACYPGYAVTNLKALSDKLTLPLTTDVEKFRAIYTWVCANIENDYTLFKTNQHQTAKLKDDPAALDVWRREFSQRVFQVLARHNRTICTGYAYLLRELAHHAGIRCVIVHGYGRTAQANIRGAGNVNHSWNAVQLDGRWYLCDATWSSGAIDPTQGIFIKNYSDNYFLADPALFVRNHYPVDTAYITLRDKPPLQAFLHAPLIYDNIYKYKTVPLTPSTFDVDVVKGEPVMFEFRKDDGAAMGRVAVRKGNSSEDVMVVAVDSSEVTNHYCFDYTFHTRGRQVVHVLIDDQYAWTYTVQVR
jgi:hypothetical protein